MRWFMHIRLKRRFHFGILMILLSGFLMESAVAENETGFDSKRAVFCRTMLSHAKEALARGDDDKAGYYFQQAVRSDPVQMAVRWFNQRRDNGEEAQSGLVRPSPPMEAPVQEADDGQPFQVIMGDDEGC